MSTLFEYRKLANGLGIADEELGELEACVRAQYGPDEMMVELRMLRTLQAIDEGALTLADTVAEFRGDPAQATRTGT
jgi:hypothetical protein